MKKENLETKDNQQVNTERIHGLDALRTLAIIGVTLFHVFPEYMQGGYLGVSLFFVLTGFLLAYTTKISWQSGTYSLFGYYKKRVLRIYPELILVIFISLGIFKLLAPLTLDGLRNELMSIFLGYNNWWQIAQNADYFSRMMNVSPFTHLWFLGIELQYYIVWPLLFWLYVSVCKANGLKSGKALMYVLAISSAMIMPLMYTPNIDVTRLYYGTDTRIYAFLFGAIMGLTFTTPAKIDNMVFQQSDKLKAVLLLLLLAITSYAAVVLNGQYSFTYQGGMLGMTVIFCAMLYLVTHSSSKMATVLDNPLLTWLGKYSYGIFLWQYPVVYLFQQMNWTSVPYYQLGELLIILVLAWLSSFVVDCALSKRIFLCGQKKYAMRTVLAGIICILSLCFVGYGCCSLATASPDTKDTFQAELKEQLAEQSEKLSEQQNITPEPNIPPQTQPEDIHNNGDSIPPQPNILPQAQPKDIHNNSDSTLSQPNIPPQSQPKDIHNNGDSTLSQLNNPPQTQLKKDINLQLTGINCVGDSIMLGAASELAKLFPKVHVDAKVSRYVGDGVPIFRKLVQAKTLSDIVVVHLGTNGPICGAARYEKKTQELLQVIGDKRMIFWINSHVPGRSWESQNNAYLAKLAATHKNIIIVDWHGFISKHREWLYKDRVHPNVKGSRQYAKLLRDTIVKTLKERNAQEQVQQ